MIIDTHLHWPVCCSPKAVDLLSIMDVYQIDRALVMGWEVLFKTGDNRLCNDMLIDFCKQMPSRLNPLATVHLSHNERAVEEVQRCIAHGAKGFKFHPWMQGENIFCPTMYNICELVSSYDVPLIFHDGTPPYSLPSQIGLLASMFKKTIFVLGHGGILHFWEEAIDVVLNNKNVYITLCGQHPRAMHTICSQVDTYRILFGTDYIGPGAEEYIAYRKGLLDTIQLDAETRSLILEKNASRLYNLH